MVIANWRFRQISLRFLLHFLEIAILKRISIVLKKTHGYGLWEKMAYGWRLKAQILAVLRHPKIGLKSKLDLPEVSPLINEQTGRRKGKGKGRRARLPFSLPFSSSYLPFVYRSRARLGASPTLSKREQKNIHRGHKEDWNDQNFVAKSMSNIKKEIQIINSFKFQKCN